MTVELGAPVVLVQGVDALWHIPADPEARGLETGTLCRLIGVRFAYNGPVRRRRCCAVCRKAHRYAAHLDPEYVEPAREHRPSGRPKGKYRLVTDAQLRVLHHVYVNEPCSVRELSRRYWQQLGYRTVQACATSLDHQFRAAGLPLRTVTEALVLRNTKHGRKPRAIAGTPAEYEYRKQRRRELGLYRPRCKGVREQYPRKGDPCQRPAAAGSDYCWAHDPAKQAERDAHLERMRGQQRHRSPAATTPASTVVSTGREVRPRMQAVREAA